MELDEAAAAAAAGSQVVEAADFGGEGGDDLFDAAELLRGEAAVGEVGHGVHDQEGAGAEDGGGDEEAQEGIGGGPVGPADHEEGREGGGVDPEVGAVV